MFRTSKVMNVHNLFQSRNTFLDILAEVGKTGFNCDITHEEFKCTLFGKMSLKIEIDRMLSVELYSWGNAVSVKYVDSGMMVVGPADNNTMRFIAERIVDIWR